jgi:hypothetical protein
MRNVNVKCIDGIGLLGRFGVRLLVSQSSPLPLALLVVRLGFHRLDKITEGLSKVLCLLCPQTLNQLVGDIRRALHFRQEVITEEINRFLTPSLEGVSKKHGNFE